MSPVLFVSMLLYEYFLDVEFQESALHTELQSKLHLLDVVRASYRFIQLESASFECLWDWSPFLDLLVYKELSDYELNQDSIDVRWCAVQILSLVLRLSDEATRRVSLKVSCLTEEMTFACLLR